MANVITGIRIICSVCLAFCPTFSQPFYVFYIICGLSDVLDGFVARHFGKETEFGAKFDTVADIVFTAVVLIKLLTEVPVPNWLIVWVSCIALIKVVTIVRGFIISGHFVSEHTVMNKACGVLLFALPLCLGLFLRNAVVVLVIFTCVAATIAAIQEGIRVGGAKV